MTKSSTLAVPGATLHHVIQGAGPVVLMICGGPTDADLFAGLAAPLADHYTVVRYDPRGNSRSRVEVAGEDQRVDVHADDAARLLRHVGKAPAYVFGQSGGGIVALELVARHPSLVHTAVVHEPPLLAWLPEHATLADDVYATYRRDGVAAGMLRFMAAAGIKGPPPEVFERMVQGNPNFEQFLAHGLRPVSRHVPDVAALRAASTRIVVAAGELSQGTAAYQGAAALAERLGSEVVHVPGDHGGFMTHTGPFAEVLHALFRGA